MGVIAPGYARVCRVIPAGLARAGPRRYCEPVNLQCQDFKTQHDCELHAPVSVCAWNGTSCEYITSWTCPNNATSCPRMQAVEVETNPLAPRALVDDWVTSPAMAAQQPDVLVFAKGSPTSTWLKDPMWRIASTDTCSCLTDFNCSRPLNVRFDPRDEANATGMLQCSRFLTIATFSTNVLWSYLWEDLNATAPLANSSMTRYSTLDEAFLHGYLDKFEAEFSYTDYFAQCAPAVCTYSVTAPPTLESAITLTIGVLGGVAVAIRCVAAARLRASAPPCPTPPPSPHLRHTPSLRPPAQSVRAVRHAVRGHAVRGGVRGPVQGPLRQSAGAGCGRGAEGQPRDTEPAIGGVGVGVGVQ